MVDLFGGAIFDFKDAKLSQLDTTVFDQAINNRIQRLLHRFLGQRLGNTQRLGDLSGDFLFCLQTVTNNLALWLTCLGLTPIITIRLR